MYQFPIGVILESFRCDRGTAVRKAAELGFSGIQLYATEGENAPENLDAAARRALRREIGDAGLVISAVCGDLGFGFGDRERNPVLLEKSKRILDLANDLGTNIITTHIGVVPRDRSAERYGVMQEACFDLAEYADRCGSHFAIETGPEPAAVLKTFLDGLGSTGVAVNLDPANLRMVAGDDPVAAVFLLRDYIVHTHAKDGTQLLVGDPEYLYGIRPMPESMLGKTFFEELPLGTGQVDFPAYLKALEEIGYRGFLTVEREVGDDPEGDIRAAHGFLRSVLAAN